MNDLMIPFIIIIIIYYYYTHVANVEAISVYTHALNTS